MASRSPVWLHPIRRLVQLTMALSLVLALALPVIDAGGRDALAMPGNPAGTVSGTSDPSASGATELPPVGEDGEPSIEPDPSLDEEPSQNDEPSIGPDIDESPSAEPSGTSEIEIEIRACPASLLTTEYDDLATECPEPVNGVSVTLSPDGTTRTSGPPEPDGIVRFTDLTDGDYELELAIPDGIQYAFPLSCDSNGPPPAIDEGRLVAVSTADVTIGMDERVSCDWYLVEGASDPAISITKYLCPAGYDVMDPDADPEMDCQETLSDIDFLLERTAPDTATRTITTDQDGRATLDEIEPGTWELSEQPSDEFPEDAEGFRYCTDFGFGQPGYEAVNVGETFTFEVDEDEIFEGVCRWYDIPGQVDDADGIATLDTIEPGMWSLTEVASADYPAGANGFRYCTDFGFGQPGTTDTDSMVEILKFECPSYYDFQANGADPAADCTVAVDASFSLYDADGNRVGSGATTNGRLSLTGLEGGDYSLEETFPLDSSYTSWFGGCLQGNDDVNYPEIMYQGPLGPDDRLDLTIEDVEGQSDTVVCMIYNVPGGSQITVYKWLCPVDYDYTATGADPVIDCARPVDGIRFMLTQTSPGSGDDFLTTGDRSTGSATYPDIPPGSYELSEVATPYQPDGFFRCYVSGEAPGDFSSIGVESAYKFSIDEGVRFTGVCHFYNIPWDNGITVYKWSCPYGYDWEAPGSDPYADCTEVSNGVGFTVTQDDASLTGASGNDGPGQVDFDGLAPGAWTVEETPPTGYMGVLIGTCYPYDTEPDGTYGVFRMNETWSVPVEIAEGGDSRWVCHFFNIYSNDPGTVIIEKWTCPAGYDYTTWYADPAADCTDATNGVRFNAEGPNGYASQTDTGDSIDGAVMFGGIEPGEYVFTETLPPDTAYVFITTCTGTSVDAVQPYPLWVGNPLTVRVNPGDRITCSWYNVPYDPYGTIVVTKYLCSTYTYTSSVNCEIYEGGIGFDLLTAGNGTTGQVANGVTGPDGRLTFPGIDPGTYLVHEQDGEPCYITATIIDGGYIGVVEGQTTYVNVYNCRYPPSSGSPSGKPRPSNQPPGKYPDTGVDPTAGVDSQDVAGSGESPSPEANGPDDDDFAAAEDGSDASSTGGCVTVTAANAEVEPSPSPSSDESPSPGPSPSDLPVTAASLAPSPDPSDAPECDRGELPVHIAIADADVDHDLEYLETVDGGMQAPTGADDASWYLETSRLGEDGPMVIAGHLNWWNVPEGPFYAIADLEPGAIIEVTGADGGIYEYEVRSVAQAPSDSSPSDVFDSVQDQLGGETLVLITCGGEWDTSIAEYNQRTVVVAVRVPADEAGD